MTWWTTKLMAKLMSLQYRVSCEVTARSPAGLSTVGVGVCVSAGHAQRWLLPLGTWKWPFLCFFCDKKHVGKWLQKVRIGKL